MPPVELVLDLLLRLVLPAAVSSAVVLGLTMWLLDRKWWDCGLAGAVAAGLLIGNALRAPLPYVPYDNGWPWLLPCAAASLVFSAVTITFLSQKLAARAILNVVAVSLLMWCLVPGELRTATWLLGFGLLVLGNMLVLELAAQQAAKEQHTSWVVPLAWATVLAGGAAAVLIYAHSARFADAAALLAAALVGIAPLAWRSPLDLRPAALTVATYLLGLMLSGYHATYSDVPPASFALVAAAPLSLALLWLPAVRRWPASAQAALQVMLPSLPVAVAVGLAIRAEGFSLEY